MAMVVTCSLLVVAVGGATGALVSLGADSPLPSTGESDPISAAGVRLASWAPTLLLQPLGLIGAVAVGMWAAHRRILEDPQRHRLLLRRAAVGGLAVAVLGGLPMGVLTCLGDAAGVSDVALLFAGGLHYASGYGGIGYAALIGLAVLRIRDTTARLPQALAACGQRSLSCYLTQSLVFGLLLAAWAGGLGAQIGLTTATAMAAGTWPTTVLAAEIMRRRQLRGPAELVLRYLTYRNRRLSKNHAR